MGNMVGATYEDAVAWTQARIDAGMGGVELFQPCVDFITSIDPATGMSLPEPYFSECVAAYAILMWGYTSGPAQAAITAREVSIAAHAPPPAGGGAKG